MVYREDQVLMLVISLFRSLYTLKPLQGDLFTAQVTDFQFEKGTFLDNGGRKCTCCATECREISQKENQLSSFNPRISQSELEVQKIIQVQYIVTQLLIAFIDAKRVTKSHISTTIALTRVIVPRDNKRLVKLKTCQKNGRPMRAKDKNPRKIKSNVTKKIS